MQPGWFATCRTCQASPDLSATHPASHDDSTLKHGRYPAQRCRVCILLHSLQSRCSADIRKQHERPMHKSTWHTCKGVREAACFRGHSRAAPAARRSGCCRWAGCQSTGRAAAGAGKPQQRHTVLSARNSAPVKWKLLCQRKAECVPTILGSTSHRTWHCGCQR